MGHFAQIFGLIDAEEKDERCSSPGTNASPQGSGNTQPVSLVREVLPKTAYPLRSFLSVNVSVEDDSSSQSCSQGVLLHSQPLR